MGVNCGFVAGTNDSPQENCHNNSSHHGSDMHAAQSKPTERVGPESPSHLLLFLHVIQMFWVVLAIKSDRLRHHSDTTSKPRTNAFNKTLNRIQLSMLSYPEQRWAAFVCPEKCLVYVELELKMHQDVLLFRPMRQKGRYGVCMVI